MKSAKPVRTASCNQPIRAARAWWRELRESLKMSQQQVANGVGWGLTQNWLHDYEQGRTDLPLSTREALREFYERKLVEREIA
jgi:DNA-binding transcriptional regulator YiaG